MKALVIGGIGLVGLQLLFLGVALYCDNKIEPSLREHFETRFGPRGCEVRFVTRWRSIP